MLEKRKQAELDRERIVRKRRCCSRSSGAPGLCAIFDGSEWFDIESSSLGGTTTNVVRSKLVST